MYWAPQTEMMIEIARIMPIAEPDPDFACNIAPSSHEWYDIDGYVQTSVADVEELRLALGDGDMPDEVCEGIITEYVGLRDTLMVYATASLGRSWWRYPALNTQENWRAWYEDEVKTRGDLPYDYRQLGSYPCLEETVVPEGLPVEFDLYMQGAILYYQGRWTEAREKWEEVLGLPAENRRYRSTWAAYMIGKTLIYEDPALAKEWLEQVRDLAREGYADSIGLAASSYNLEARAEIELGNYAPAIERYLDSYATGDETALVAIRLTTFRMFGTDNEALLAAARNPRVRELVSVNLDTSYDCSSYSGRSDPMERWLNALETVGAVDVETVDLLAWNAYRAGQLDLAQRWLEMSPETGLALWLRAKFAMRDGNLEGAADMLERALNAFPTNEIWFGEINWWSHGIADTTTIPTRRILAELGMIRLTLGRLEEALDSFLRGDYWMDAAYVAEDVLTADELIAYVDENWPWPGERPQVRRWNEPPPEIPGDPPEVVARRIRYLLARRLTRIGRVQEAREYYPLEFRSILDTYLALLRMGGDTSRARSERAELLWQAAQIARYKGMELMGTELYPDDTMERGNYPIEDMAQLRAELPPVEVRYEWFVTTYERFTPTSEEIDRTRTISQEVQPEMRFHYRFIACDIAWAACELMPDESDETAYRLCVAGSWIKYEDPEAADRFYKALVNRCRSTWLGREADRIRWFPNCDSVPPAYASDAETNEPAMAYF